MANIPTDEKTADATILTDDDIDEGCVLDIIDAGHWLPPGASATVKNDGLPAPVLTNAKLCPSAKDSGLCSRMSEVGGETTRHSLLLDGRDEKNLAKKLTRISEYRNESSCNCQWTSVVKTLVKILAVVTLLYCFICTLDLLSNAFRLLGGKTAGSVFSDSELLTNPITGLMIGVLATVILQSSSTSSSIVITMVASNIIEIQPAIPIIMGANIGTTVTNTLVSLAHSTDRKEFRRAFSGAVVHDVFNWLTVLILLPLEFCTGYLYYVTKTIINTMDLEGMKTSKMDLLKTLTKPLTSRVVMVDKKVITGIAEGKEGYANKSLLKIHCVYDTVQRHVLVNKTVYDNTTDSYTWEIVNETKQVDVPLEKCHTLFSNLGWGDTTSGIVLFIASIALLSLCLYLMVKTLHSLLGGHIAKAARKTINADFPYPFSWLTGYAAIIVGAGMTILVQSSSVFTSALTPLVGIGCLKLERMFPLTLGSNIGTTGTGILAALASSSTTMHIALQLALCHLFFNITGILLFYPIPKMRRLVLGMAKFLGRTTARYRWFAVAYLIGMFLIFPGSFFALSFAGQTVFVIGISVIGLLVTMVVIINCLQNSQRLSKILPDILKSWEFLPEGMRSLAPYDRCLGKMVEPLASCCCECCVNKCSCLQPTDPDLDMGSIDDSDDEDDSNLTSVQSSYLSSAASSKAVLNQSMSFNEFNSVFDSRRIYKPLKLSNSRSQSRRGSGILVSAEPSAVNVTQNQNYLLLSVDESTVNSSPSSHNASNTSSENTRQKRVNFSIGNEVIGVKTRTLRSSTVSDDVLIIDISKVDVNTLTESNI